MKKLCLLLPLVLAACEAEPQLNKVEVVVGNNAADSSSGGGVPRLPAEATANAQAPAAAPGRTDLGIISFVQDRSLAPFETRISVPPLWESEVNALKLIPIARAAMIGAAQCSYGQSGASRPCSAEMEAGLAFAVLEQPFAQLRARITDPAPTPVTLAGREGIRWEIGAEGEGAEYTLLPAGTRTVLIMRQYRSGGGDDAQAYRAVLNSLAIDER